MASTPLGVLRHWKVVAPGLVSGILLLLIICIILSMPDAKTLLLEPPSLQGFLQEEEENNNNINNKFLYPNQVVGHSSLQHQFHSPRRILQNEYPRSRPSPTSYPPPKQNIRRAPFRRPQSPPRP